MLVQRDGPGVPRQRYFGKQKAVANLELRSMFYRFKIKSNRFGLGALAFGGGLRITWGETLVIRVDPAWSPTDENFGFYIDIGQMF